MDIQLQEFQEEPNDYTPLLWKELVHIFLGATAPQWAMAYSFTSFLYHTQRRTIVGWTALDEGSARRKDLYLHDTHNRRTTMPPVGFEPTISADERSQIYALDLTATGTGIKHVYSCLLCLSVLKNGKKTSTQETVRLWPATPYFWSIF